MNRESHLTSCVTRALWCLAIACAIPAGPARAASEDEFEFAAPSVSQVNEGALVFLSRPPEKSVHQQANHVVIVDSSLADGWVELHQCHDQLDAVSRSQIVFNSERTREVRVTESAGIGAVWVEGATVQLKDTGRSARLCLSVLSRALEREGDGSYTLRSGPFMRRFLDGYYPMHVSMRVSVAARGLRYVGAQPQTQPGFRVWQDGGEVYFDALFEGRLTTRLSFRGPEPI